MSTDLTFITNEKNEKLIDRFKVLIKDTEFFDVLVGYFFTSGFYPLYKSLEKTKKIRILIGIGTNKQTVDLIEQSKAKQSTFQFSHAEVKEQFSDDISNEMEDSQDNQNIEEGVNKFLEWLVNGKLEIKAFPTENLHAKVYIMSFLEGDRDKGRVITGSSNFSQSGLADNLEFNVELKNRADYDFAKVKFEDLWADAVDVKDKYIKTIQTRTWLNNTITPYELYLKFLYEYFKDEISRTDEVLYKYVPVEFKKLEYQEQAVLNAKKILDEYGGVFISDVVGLGKTYMATMLAQQLDGRTLVIAPPMLLKKENPGSWPNVFLDFRLSAEFESLGKLDLLIKRGTDKYQNIIIDEAHRFRTETTISYEKLAQICRGKRVILVTATPYNNHPKDVLSQIKLFQKPKNSTIPGLQNLERFFTQLANRLKNLDRQRDYIKYMKIIKDNSKEIREKVLKYLMVRRTRTEILKYFGEDLKEQKLKFPEVADPEPIFYELDDEEDKIFNRTIELVAQKFKYARYTPLLYYTGDKLDQLEIQAQRNMGRFMKILLIKRLESSFYAFRNTLDRFINSYESFLKEYEKGNVYVSKKHTNKIFELIENDDDEAIQRLIDQDKAQKYESEEFKKDFKKDLEHDLNILKEIKKSWASIIRDPKLIKFIETLKREELFKDNKIIIFSESKETAEYLTKNLKEKFSKQILLFTGSSGAPTREKVIENFDAKARYPKNDYTILITTEVLSEGVNLHQSNVVINYDIPWNPTRLIQRVGRINRVDTKFDKIYTFNFFPTKQSNDLIKLKEAAEAKINAFISLLGSDAQLLTEGEPIESHELFSRLVSKKTITGEDEKEVSELKYLKVIKDIRDKDADLFEKIKRLPKKARTARKVKKPVGLLTFFRKGKLQKFYFTDFKNYKALEYDFMTAAGILEASNKIKREKLGKDFYKLLDQNKKAFELTAVEEMPDLILRGGRDSASQILKILKAVKDTRQLTEEQELYLKQVIRKLEEGDLPKPTMKKALKGLNTELKAGVNPRKIVGVLQTNISSDLLKEHIAGSAAQTAGPREVILSEYFIGE